jgi:hypothetical protein
LYRAGNALRRQCLARLDKRARHGTSAWMSMKAKPDGPAPSPNHYWHAVKGVWKLRKGVRKHDPDAEYERLAQLKLEARARPPRTGRPPSSQYQTMTMSQTIEAVERALNGDLIPAPRAPMASSHAPTDGRWTCCVRLAAA